MSTVRRWYTYLVCAITLQAVAWAFIALMRTLFIFGIDPIAASFQIAVVIIGLPVFLGHWLSVQRLAGRSVEERSATLRRLYLYGMMAGFLGPFTANAFDLIGTLFQAGSTLRRQPYRISSTQALLFHSLALVILGVLWFYHQRITKDDAISHPESGSAATIRRLYILGFSAAGLTMVTLSIIHLVRWVMLQFGGSVVQAGSLSVGLTEEITRLIVGVPIWLIFWRWAGSLFAGPKREERESTLRKFYLYGAVFIGAMSVVGNTTAILAGLLRRVLSLPSQGDIRLPLPIIIGMGILWAYHAFVIRDDAEATDLAPRQVGVRRLYMYLIAFIGLSALLVGLSGDTSVIIRSLDSGFGSELREQLAWFTAAIIVGLPVWFIPWRQEQYQATTTDARGADSRRSIMRKIYLYFFLFIATMTVLSSVVFIVFRVLSMIFGEDPPTLIELGHAISFSLIAIGVWFYHSSILRSDRKLIRDERLKELQAMRVMVVDVDGGIYGEAVIKALREEIPELALTPITLNPSGEETIAESAEAHIQDITTQVSQAGLIVGSWMITVPAGFGGKVSADFAQAVMDSPAQKLLVPTREKGWEWVGVDRWDEEALVRQTTHAIHQILEADEVKARRPLGIGSIVALIIGGLVLLTLVGAPLYFYFAMGY